jgi:hypothetical protein
MSGIPDKVVELLLGDLDEEPDGNEAQGREAEEQFVELIRGGPFHGVALLHKFRRLGKHIRKGAEHQRLIRRPIIAATDQIGRRVDTFRHGQPMRMSVRKAFKPIVCLAGTRQKNVDGFLHFVLSDCLSGIPDSLADLGKLQRKRIERLRCCAYSIPTLFARFMPRVERCMVHGSMSGLPDNYFESRRMM